MKKVAVFVSVLFVLALSLGGCQAKVEDREAASASAQSEPEPSISQADESDPALTDNPDDSIDLSILPATMASAEDLNDAGGYLLIGEVPEEDIGIYCENAETRDRVYIRYGPHIQSFRQEAWADPTILPRVEWQDWDGDGNNELVVDYLRHEGEYFDGKTTSPGVVGERVVYRWDGEKWTELHFSN